MEMVSFCPEVKANVSGWLQQLRFPCFSVQGAWAGFVRGQL